MRNKLRRVLYHGLTLAVLLAAVTALSATWKWY